MHLFSSDSQFFLHSMFYLDPPRTSRRLVRGGLDKKADTCPLVEKHTKHDMLGSIYGDISHGSANTPERLNQNPG